MINKQKHKGKPGHVSATRDQPDRTPEKLTNGTSKNNNKENKKILSRIISYIYVSDESPKRRRRERLFSFEIVKNKKRFS